MSIRRPGRIPLLLIRFRVWKRLTSSAAEHLVVRHRSDIRRTTAATLNLKQKILASRCDRFYLDILLYTSRETSAREGKSDGGPRMFPVMRLCKMRSCARSRLLAGEHCSQVLGMFWEYLGDALPFYEQGRGGSCFLSFMMWSPRFHAQFQNSPSYRVQTQDWPYVVYHLLLQRYVDCQTAERQLELGWFTEWVYFSTAERLPAVAKVEM